MSGWPVGLNPVYLSPGEEVRLRHQILLSIQQLPHVVPFLLQKHSEELAVHWAGQAHLLVVLQDRKNNTDGKHSKNVEVSLLFIPKGHNIFLISLFKETTGQ